MSKLSSFDAGPDVEPRSPHDSLMPWRGAGLVITLTSPPEADGTEGVTQPLVHVPHTKNTFVPAALPLLAAALVRPPERIPTPPFPRATSPAPVRASAREPHFVHPHFEPVTYAASTASTDAAAG